ncbi:hypothetical protein QE152_g7795 [Popillia japonica]|uniref:Uncharacterized protein n=1 Tax=Popillia japonica TaxID=7064 RepID=A0AAW1MF72_POPJA
MNEFLSTIYHPTPFRKYMSNQRAATIIQAVFGDYSTRTRSSTAFLVTAYRNKRPIATFYQLAKDPLRKTDSYNKSDSLRRLFLIPSQKLMSVLVTNFGPEKQSIT